MTNNLEQLAFYIQELSEEDFQHIFNATRPRLLSVHHKDTDNKSNRVLCDIDTSNILYDIRDYVEHHMRNR